MKYYVTIYIDELLEFQTIKDLLNMKGSDLTHAFLGLTKGKSPDELDDIDIDKELIQEYLKNKEFKLFKNIKKISYNKTIYLY